MQLKRTLSLTVFSFLFFTHNAFAITEGSYLGIDALYSKGSFNEDYYYGSTHYKDNHDFKDANFGGGINFKHAFNYDGVFIAPGAFYEYSNLSMKEKDFRYSGIRDTRQLDIKSRFGAKVDLGYDITEEFAFYITAGYGAIQYRAKNIYYDSVSTVKEASKSGLTGSVFYGAGLKYDIAENLAAVFEFNIQDFEAKTKTNVPGDISNKRGTYETKIFISKLGLAYKF